MCRSWRGWVPTFRSAAAPPSCAPCRKIEPLLEQLAAETDDVEFVRMDVDSNPVSAARYDVLSLPTVAMFSAGELRKTVIGARSRKHYAQAFGLAG